MYPFAYTTYGTHDELLHVLRHAHSLLHVHEQGGGIELVGTEEFGGDSVQD